MARLFPGRKRRPALRAAGLRDRGLHHRRDVCHRGPEAQFRGRLPGPLPEGADLPASGDRPGAGCPCAEPARCPAHGGHLLGDREQRTLHPGECRPPRSARSRAAQGRVGTIARQGTKKRRGGDSDR